MVNFDKFYISYKDVNFKKNLLVNLLKKMIKIRVFEKNISKLVIKGKVNVPCHLYIGQEAIAVGVCSVLKKEDCVFSNHRNHGHYIAKGGNIKKAIAEILCKRNGCSSGRGGSLHLIDPNVSFMGSSAIVGGNLPLAVGAAHALLYNNTQNISVVFHGDGSTEEGVWSESLNYASLYSLPILFICENNLYASHLPLEKGRNSKIIDITKSYNIESISIDGNNVLEVYSIVNKFVKSIRKHPRPIYIECNTFRQREHCGALTQLEAGNINIKKWEYWINRCPIDNFASFLAKNGIISKEEIINLYKSITNEIKEATISAQDLLPPDEDSLNDFIYKV